MRLNSHRSFIDAFSYDELFKVECPDKSSINDMKTRTESTIEAIVQNTGPGGASVWTAQTETGQIVGYAQWKHAVCLSDQDTEQHKCSGSLLSALSFLQAFSIDSTGSLAYFFIPPKTSKSLRLIRNVKQKG
ncbi:hypothetical protein BDV34DRAFT_219305 [Aspergillus parasiticus]|uniref:Uncharacterized protein n=1 Tax=Aspergillus parasiticus TaxID=5067 RepID=A0A5N6E3G1_ASPPA|nr:hypothetical protein BDV34DRAFT_219305 [Aspergillus parasiticus]